MALGGASPLLQESQKSGLPVPSLPVAMATERALLSPPLRALSVALMPEQFILDCGGQGQCGPNTLALLLGLVGLFDLDGLSLRKRVCKHARESGVMDALTPFKWRDSGEFLTTRELCTESFKSWPTEFQQGLEPSEESYLTVVEQKEAWTDLPFCLLSADCFEIIAALTGVNDLSDVFPMPVLGPLQGQKPKAWLDIGCWVGKHFVAIVLVAPEATAALARAGSIPAEDGTGAAEPRWSPSLVSLLVSAKGRGMTEVEQAEQRELASFDWPLTTVEEFKRLLQCKYICPQIMIAMEFSAAMKSAYRRRGKWAVTVDKRSCEQGQMHYRGDVRDVLYLHSWLIVWFYPNCFQQLLGDIFTLPFKISDSRAFWGIAMTLFCICCTCAKAIAMEQPNTLAPRYIDLSELPATSVTEFHTDQWGDEASKFTRLTTRNLKLPAPIRPTQHRSDPNRSQWNYASNDERDRARSTWANNPHMCDALAGAELVEDAFPPVLSFAAVILAFAKAWEADGLPVPGDYANADAQPTDPDFRKYVQEQRGVGDGRAVYKPCSVQDVPPIPVLLGAGDPLARQEPMELGAPAGDMSVSMEVDDCDDPRLRSLLYHARVAGEAERNLQDPPFVDCQLAAAASALLVFTCVLISPVVLAHVNGFSVVGFELPPDTPRSATANSIQRFCNRVHQGASILSFMVGEYSNGHRLFTAPVEVRPREAGVCRTKSHRLKLLASGATLVWCALAALAGTPAYDCAARALLAAGAFTGPTELLADASLLPGSDETVIFSIGKMRETAVIKRPLLADEACPAPWRAVMLGHAWEQSLRTALEKASSSLLDGWLDAFKPLPLGEIPAKLWSSLDDWSDSRLDTYPLPKVSVPHVTPWRPLPPRQAALPREAPACPQVQDLYLEEGWSRMQQWFESARLDMVDIQEQLARGVTASHVRRDFRAQAIAVGDSERVEWAQGTIFDCRGKCCTPLDFDAPFSSELNLPAYAKYLASYPDQALVANILHGVTLEADIELQSVLVSHVTSIADGFTSVEEELHRLQGLDYLDFFSHAPYSPLIVSGNGAAVRAHEERRRRTVEAGGPRSPTFDASGLQAISINSASHIHHIPQYFLHDLRPEFQEWIDARGLRPAYAEAQLLASQAAGQCRATADAESEGRWLDAILSVLSTAGDGFQCWDGFAMGEEFSRGTKWVKEIKPTLEWLGQIVAVLRRAAYFLSQPIYIWTDDLKDMFNQLGLASSELWKQNTIFLRRADDQSAAAAPPELMYVSERRLGFGTHGASNIAQRWDDANLEIFRDRMDEWEASQPKSQRLEDWHSLRRQVQAASEEVGHCTRRWHATAEEQPPSPTEATVTTQCSNGGVYVEPQLRLYGSLVYSDDVVHVSVGIERTLAQMSIWRELVTELQLKMAKPEKRALGTWVKWLGIIVVVSLGALIIPRVKLVRARHAIGKVMGNECTFGDYRSLIGLLEHFRCVNLRSRNVMHGLYEPHGPDGASREGPGGLVICSELMVKQLQRWLLLVLQSAGVGVKRAVLRSHLEPLPALHLITDCDACHGDEPTSGLAGCCHGFWWYFPVPDEHYHLVYTAFLEFLAFVFNIVIFDEIVAPRGIAGEVTILGRTDALTTALTLPAQSQHSPVLVELFQRLIETAEWKRASGCMSVMHLFGNGNPLSDYASRAKMREFHQLCGQLGIRPIQLPVPQRAVDIYLNSIQQLATRYACSQRIFRNPGAQIEEEAEAEGEVSCWYTWYGSDGSGYMSVPSFSLCGMDFEPTSPPPDPHPRSFENNTFGQGQSRRFGTRKSWAIPLDPPRRQDEMRVVSADGVVWYRPYTRYHAFSVAELPSLDQRHEWRQFKCLCNGWGHGGRCQAVWWKVAPIDAPFEADDMCEACQEAWTDGEWRCHGACSCDACSHHPGDNEDWRRKAIETFGSYQGCDPYPDRAIGSQWPEPEPTRRYEHQASMSVAYASPSSAEEDAMNPSSAMAHLQIDPALPWSVKGGDQLHDVYSAAYFEPTRSCDCERIHFDGRRCCPNKVHGNGSRCNECASDLGSCNQPPSTWVKCGCPFCGEGGCHFLVPPPPESEELALFRSRCVVCRQRCSEWQCDCNCACTALPSRDMELGEDPVASPKWEHNADNPFLGMCCGADDAYVAPVGTEAHVSRKVGGLPAPLAAVPPNTLWQKVACTCVGHHSGTRCFNTWWEVTPTNTLVEDRICNQCAESLPILHRFSSAHAVPPGYTYAEASPRVQSLQGPCYTCECVGCTGEDPDVLSTSRDHYGDGFSTSEKHAIEQWLAGCQKGITLDEHGEVQTQYREAPVDLPWHITRGGLFVTENCNCNRVHYDGWPNCENTVNELYRDCSRCDDCRDEEGSCNQPPARWVKCSCLICGNGQGCNFLVPPPAENDDNFEEWKANCLCQCCHEHQDDVQPDQLDCECLCAYTAMPSREMEQLPAHPMNTAGSDNAFLGMCCVGQEPWRRRSAKLRLVLPRRRQRATYFRTRFASGWLQSWLQLRAQSARQSLTRHRLHPHQARARWQGMPPSYWCRRRHQCKPMWRARRWPLRLATMQRRRPVNSRKETTTWPFSSARVSSRGSQRQSMRAASMESTATQPM